MEGRHTRERKKIAPNPENPAPPRMEAVAPVKSRVPFCRSTMPCMTCQAQTFTTSGIIKQEAESQILLISAAELITEDEITETILTIIVLRT